MFDRHSKGSLMLLEMLFVVFFFAIISAVYVQVFVGSKTMSEKSRNLSEATLIAQNMIEVFTEANGNFEETAAFLRPKVTSDGSTSADLPGMTITTNSITLYYNDLWEMLAVAAPADVAYTATLSVGGGAESTHLLTGRVTVANTKGERICELPVSLFLRGAKR